MSVARRAFLRGMMAIGAAIAAFFAGWSARASAPRGSHRPLTARELIEIQPMTGGPVLWDRGVFVAENGTEYVLRNASPPHRCGPGCFDPCLGGPIDIDLELVPFPEAIALPAIKGRL